MANETTPTAAETSDQSLDLSHLGYEQARDELMDVVRRLETGGLTLEESLAAWERGESLAKHCQGKLDGARARLDAAMGAGSGEEGREDGEG